MMMISLILCSAVYNLDDLEYSKPTLTVMILRLLCSYLFHIGNHEDIGQAYRRLKFLCNNPDKFYRKQLLTAFIMTQYQFIAAMGSEVANILFMTRQDTILDHIMNYVAFEGISKIDNVFADTAKNFNIDAIKDEGNKEGLEEALAFTRESHKNKKDS